MSHPLPETDQVISLHGSSRWEVYYRLQVLGIPCECSMEEPLRASISTPNAALQVWSIVRQITLPRHELANWLQGCWELEADGKKA